MTLELVTIGLAERSRIREVWCGLADASPPSYFLSWGWVETWLDALPPSSAVVLHVAKRGGAPVAAFFVGARTRWRHRVVRSRELYWNQTGHAGCDEICIEYNGVVHGGTPPPLAELLARLPGAWDEVYLPAMDAGSQLARGVEAAAAAADRWVVRVERRVPSPMVDLAKVREAGDYLKLLGGSTRSQIRRAQKLYGARGKLALDVAGSVDEAMAMFDELVALHRRSWRERGEEGAFLPFVLAFHRRLIEQRFAAGEIQVARARSGDATIGCLYNFVWDGNVSFYQSGLTYETDSKLKPGLVCHALGIERAAKAGHRWYDFLAGVSRYKQSLATDARELVWLRAQKPRLQFKLEDLAREVRDRVRAARAARAGSAQQNADTLATGE